MAAKKSGKEEELQPIIVKKIKKNAAGHHGGAWKVAYADFVTAMMAFFLLLWLLNVTTEDAQNVISSYFDPSHPKVSQMTSGSGGVMGGTSMATQGAMVSSVQPISAPQPQMAAQQGAQNTQEISREQLMKRLEEDLRKEEDEGFKKAKEELEATLQENAELRELAKHLMVDVTEEGLRIQIVDQEGEPMFPIGSADMFDKTRNLLLLAAQSISGMPNEVSVRGHTDSHKYAPGAKYTNWELSADRANASRRVLLESSIPEERLSNVMGKADTEHLVADNPLDARNRRITIVLLRETVQQAFERGAIAKKLTPAEVEEVKKTFEVEGYEPLPQINTPQGDFQRSPGDVYFP